MRDLQDEKVFWRMLDRVDRWRKVGRFHLALPIIKKVMRWANRKSPVWQAEAYAAWGLVQRGLERYGAAKKALRKAWTIYRRLGDVRGEAYAEWGLGGCERFCGRPRSALRYFQSARKKFLRAGDRLGWAYATFGWAGALRVLGGVSESLKAYQRAWQVCREARDTFGVAYGLCGMAHALRKLSQKNGVRSLFYLRVAEGCYKRSGALYRKIGDRSSVGYTEWGLAQMAQARGEAARASRHLRRAESAFRAARDSRGLALVQRGDPTY